MKSSVLCIIYVSEGLRLNVIKRLTLKASSGGPLVHSFVDAVYGRTSFYLMGDDLVTRSLALCQEAFGLVKYDPLQGTHPALGVVDHICFSPIGPDASVSDARTFAVDFASKLHLQEGVPVFTYGEASPTSQVLGDIRRELGYFLKGENLLENMKNSPCQPFLGDNSALNPLKGVACVGAVPYLQNFNMRFRPTDERKHVVQVTKHIREPDVEALTLLHEGGSFEVACNLKRPRVVTPDAVLKKALEGISTLGLGEVLSIAHSYTTGPTEQELLAIKEEDLLARWSD